jgi:hypothetical protein
MLVLNAVTANATATVNLGIPHSTWSMQVVLTGSPSGGTITLAPSLDGTNMDPAAAGVAQFTIGTDASGTIKYVTGKPFTAFTVTLAGLTGGTMPTVTVNVQAGP